ncbi:hypothetical protein PRIPAC_95447 [Pristionchus pacificus]|nr:hypothetical protein PRIPAC_95447 [Pristionchus pacificus]
MAAPPQPQRLLSDTIRSNKGKVLVYDGDGFEYRSYHIRKDGIELFRCNKGGCKGKAKHENGQVTRYEDHNGHVPPDHSNEIRFVRKAARHDRASGVPTDQDQHLFTPILYAFLTGKSTRPYECVFQWLSAQGVPSPLTITSDFERAITSAIRSVYPMVSIQYCIFHLYKNILSAYLNFMRLHLRNISKGSWPFQ